MAVVGIKGVTILSLGLTAAALLAAIVVSDIWLLTLTFGLLSGLATGLVASVLGATVANRWFIQGRGVIVGTFGASVSAGQLVFFPLLTTIAVGFGWRAGAIVLVAIMLVLLVPVLVLFRNDPADVGQLPRGADPDTPIEPAPPPEPSIMRRAIRSSDFWFLASTFFICGATSNGLIGQHFIAHAVDHGFGQVAAAQALAVMGAFNFVGTIASGWLTDRYDPRKLLLMYYGFRGISLLFLPFVHDSSGIVVFSVLFGLDYIATVPPTVALCADRFGRRNVGIVYGWVFAAHMFGAAISAWAAGIVRENVGDYAGAFVAAGWIAIVAAFAVLGIRRERTAPASEAVPA